MLTDHDFHPDEPVVRIFRTPSPGVLRLDDDVAISEVVYQATVQPTGCSRRLGCLELSVVC